MTSHSICPLVIAKILRVTTALWAHTGKVPAHLPDTAQQSTVREGRVHDDKTTPRTAAAQRFGVQRHTAWSARPRITAVFSDRGTHPRA